MALAAPIVCVVTRVRGAMDSAARAHLLDRLSAAAAAGASMIQVRERQVDDRALLDFTRQLVEITAGSSCLVTVNDRPDIAIAAGAHGVHLKSDGCTAADVRRIAPERFTVGRSVHFIAEAVAAEHDGGYDYLLFGTVFPTASKSANHVVAGTDLLREVCARVSLPVLAIGGINVARAEEVAAAGAQGAAAISLFAEAPDIAEAVTSLRFALTRPSGRV